MSVVTSATSADKAPTGGIITKPMLAATLPPADTEASFTGVGFGATPKLDGIRAMLVGGKLVSRTFKPIRNQMISAALERLLPEGADGEIMASLAPASADELREVREGTLPAAPAISFQECTSMVMSGDKRPASITYFIFDYVKSSLDTPYAQRMADLAAWWEQNRPAPGASDAGVRIVPLLPTVLGGTGRAELDAYEAACLEAGFEGAMLRRMDGRYKPGRSTLREGLLLKVKRFEDDEGTVIGVEELVRTGDAGVPSGVAGALVVRWDPSGVVFNIGTGFSAADRAEIWQRREALVAEGQQVKFKYMTVGMKEAPRFPVFLGFRDPEDV